eukprot:TRINITY_DN31372_c0_g1_i1.p2 TRINITY_DN31372_c0_g1~~TRINITY_DN31372_c0_g1_i1.p2  ORF type:complete len:247 (+),score=118.71 TRINITY_DN31372_c0_g1_i1:37-741(+)
MADARDLAQHLGAAGQLYRLTGRQLSDLRSANAAVDEQVSTLSALKKSLYDQEVAEAAQVARTELEVSAAHDGLALQTAMLEAVNEEVREAASELAAAEAELDELTRAAAAGLSRMQELVAGSNPLEGFTAELAAAEVRCAGASERVEALRRRRQQLADKREQMSSATDRASHVRSTAEGVRAGLAGMVSQRLDELAEFMKKERELQGSLDEGTRLLQAEVQRRERRRDAQLRR